MSDRRARVMWFWLASALVAAGCGAEKPNSGADGNSYPLVTNPRPQYQPAVTTESGAVVRLPVKPSEHEIEPSPTCERMIATFHDGSTPTKRPIVVPPRPGLRARAVSSHEVELAWSFEALPSDCRPTQLLLAVTAGDQIGATPTTKMVDVAALSGTAAIVYPDFLPPPDVAMASSLSVDGHRSRLARVLISR
jgi:hypothetical protein